MIKSVYIKLKRKWDFVTNSTFNESDGWYCATWCVHRDHNITLEVPNNNPINNTFGFFLHFCFRSTCLLRSLTHILCYSHNKATRSNSTHILSLLKQINTFLSLCWKHIQTNLNRDSYLKQEISEMGSGAGTFLKVLFKNFDVLAGSVPIPFQFDQFMLIFVSIWSYGTYIWADSETNLIK